MNKKYIAISYAYLFVATCTAAYAAPTVTVDASVGLLGSPIAQAPIQDPVIQKALDWIQSKQIKKEQKEKLNPESTIGEKPRKEGTRRLILGGPEIIPM
jgi:hypothetical protein